MKKLGKVLLAILGVLLALALLLLAVRLVNGFRYPEPPALAVNLDPASYPTTVPGATVERVDLDRLQGFHLSPDTPSHDGLVVIWGGSDGGPDFARAARIAGQGYHVLSLFFFGQPGQQPILAEVPLEAFEDALRWRAEHAPGPLTVIGTSKGAELALALQARYPDIDNLVVYAPTTHTWQGLDFATEKSSWTWAGEPAPYVSFRHADPQSVTAMFAAMLLNTPVRLYQQYASALANDPDAERAAIPFKLSGHLLAFAGEDDAMWPSADAARHWGAQAPGRTEAHTYPGAGHLFGAHDGWAGGFAMGGNRAGNEAALAASDTVLDASLAAWHPAR